ncbi:hypothetical protein [Corynebacterium halotolerans]|uniref:Putative secreted protein n=1 Tax=Corynebacterium halotolerans YIM 70093 = DSM 44683 TaxID=1121362 RepID=M1MYR6_9CORY|nr:hypothetical protein [Corynebacterium halotolerans]AGF72859.1 putative secreted protein [Corynebacterium halotolerans YIM 70093 = DSM 44683]
MTMQNRPRNSIEARKTAVRKYSRNAAISVGGGVGGGLVLAFLLANSTFWLILGLVVAVVGGVYNWRKIQQVVNQRDNH